MLNIFKNKKQFIIGVITGAILFGSIGASAATAITKYICYKAAFKININGETYNNANYPALSYKEEIYMPVGALVDNLNLDLKINKKSKTVEIKEEPTNEDSQSIQNNGTTTSGAIQTTDSAINASTKLTPDGIKANLNEKDNKYYIWTSVANGKWSQEAKNLNKNIYFSFKPNYKLDDEYADTVSLIKNTLIEDKTHPNIHKYKQEVIIQDISIINYIGVPAVTYEYYINNIYPIVMKS